MLPPVGGSAAPGDPVRRVNAPYFPGGAGGGSYAQSAIFWFGQVTPTTNYTDVRVAYDDTKLYLALSVVDRRLWYSLNPTPSDLPRWDSATVYLRPDGADRATPDSSAHRFTAQLSDGRAPANYQMAERGNGSGWAAATTSFQTGPGWRGNALNDDIDDKGWTMEFHIPFSSLGLSGRPSDRTVWRLGVEVHDRDDAGGSPISDQFWPEVFNRNVPASWGQLQFGPASYTPPVATSAQSVMIRHRLNGATVPDGIIGGSGDCGGGLDYWTEWGLANYNGKGDFNVQNQADISDYPCFAKYYTTFPLTAVPAGKVITSAQLLLHQFGGSDTQTASNIQILTVDKDWNASSINWNNAPYATENVAIRRVDALPGLVSFPGVPRTWDLGYAVAQAYASGQPLRLAIYSADSDYHTGKHFVSSNTGDWNEEGRPTLLVTYGDPVGGSLPTPTSTTAPAAPTSTSTTVPAPPTSTTPPGSGGPAGSVTLQVGASAGDVNEDGSNYDQQSGSVWVGNGASTNQSYTGLRFTNVSIPRGATITSAHLELYAAQSSWIALDLDIAAENAGNSAAFSSGSRPSQRALTASRVRHSSNSQWLGGTWSSLDEMKAVIQEVVNRGDWSSGNSLAIVLQGQGSAYARKLVNGFDADPATAPKLVLSFTTSGNPAPTATFTNTPIASGPSPTRTPTPVTGGGGGNGMWQVTASADDATEDGTIFDSTSDSLWLGTGSSSSSSYAGFRFSNLTIPRGATITSARLEVLPASSAWSQLDYRLAAEASGNSGPFTSASRPSQRPLGSAAVRHQSNTQWIAGTWQPLDEIAPLIQEVVNRGDWQSGNALSLISVGTGPSWARKFIQSADGGSGARLVVTFSGGGGSVPPAAPTATSTQTSSGGGTTTFQVAGSANDVNEDAGALDLSAGTLWLGTASSGGSSYTGLRFTGVSIPRSASIVSAHLEVMPPASSWIALDLRVAADASGNSAAFSDTSRPSQRTLGVQSVLHQSNSQWQGGVWQSLDEIAPVIQEVVNRGDWQAGNSLSLILGGNGANWARKFVHSADGSAANAPRLVVTYR